MITTRSRRITSSVAICLLSLLPIMARAQEATSSAANGAVASASASTQPLLSSSSLSLGGGTDNLSKFASGTGNMLFLGAGTLLPLLEDGKDGKEHALRTADSLLTSTIITTGLKAVFREKRPDSNARTSFPSGHATAAFAVATMQASYHPKQALFWYGGATAIAYSRVKLHRHYTRDVIAGAAVGFFTSRLELSRPHGLILAPFIRSRNEGGGNGATITMNF